MTADSLIFWTLGAFFILVLIGLFYDWVLRKLTGL